LATKKFKCPICNLVYISKPALYSHLEKLHNDQLNGLSPAHFYFNFRNKKDHGSCVICKKETEFNEITERYERFCSDKCKKKYKDDFDKKMKEKYGKTSLADDPDFQAKMLKNRKISGVYTWSDGKKFDYVGSYELDFLEYLDKVIQLPSIDLFCPCPKVFEYEYLDKKHFYMPDFLISSLNLIIEIKSGTNKHYRERDLEIEKLKDKVIQNHPDYNYIKVLDKDYREFTILYNEVVNKN